MSCLTAKLVEVAMLYLTLMLPKKFLIGIYVDLSHKGHSENQRSYVSYSEPPLKICEKAEKEKNSVN